MLEKAPSSFKILLVACILLVAPVTVLGFVMGGTPGGAAALVGFFLLFIILYMLAMRLYS